MVPFHRPTLTGRELETLEEALREQRLSGDGRFTHRCEKLLEETLGVPRVLLTTSCTHALELSALLLELGPDDEVILPSFTFVSTANAFVLRGARPVFVDVRQDTLNIDEELIARAVGPRTRAIVVVHYAGVAAEMDAIQQVCSEKGVRVVEDNAHGLFGLYRGQWLGTFGALATLSFHDTKNFTCGEGGALLINDRRMADRAEILREKGTDRRRFFRGEVDKYTWVDIGSSYVLSELLAAFLYPQLSAREEIQAARCKIWELYSAGLADWASMNGVGLPRVPAECDPSYHLYYLVLPDPTSRDRLIEHLRDRGIQSAFHYLPLHLSRMGRSFGGRAGDLPVTESVCDRLLRLPFYTSLVEHQQLRIIEAVQAFRP